MSDDLTFDSMEAFARVLLSRSLAVVWAFGGNGTQLTQEQWRAVEALRAITNGWIVRT